MTRICTFRNYFLNVKICIFEFCYLKTLKHWESIRNCIGINYAIIGMQYASIILLFLNNQTNLNALAKPNKVFTEDGSGINASLVLYFNLKRILVKPLVIHTFSASVSSVALCCKIVFQKVCKAFDHLKIYPLLALINPNIDPIERGCGSSFNNDLLYFVVDSSL